MTLLQLITLELSIGPSPNPILHKPILRDYNSFLTLIAYFKIQLPQMPQKVNEYEQADSKSMKARPFCLFLSFLEY